MSALPLDDRDAAPGRSRALDVLVPELPARGGRVRVSEGRTLGGVGSRFAIATPHVEATRAGAAAFDAGGNAVDAALAAATTLAVVYPHMCGVGGDLFALVREPEGRIVVVNASGAAPAAVDAAWLERVHGEMPQSGPHAVTVPGAVSGWASLAEHWSALGFARALAPAIAAAREGIPVASSLAETLTWGRERYAADPGLASVLFPGGEPLPEGATLAQPALAATLSTIAREGPDAVYGGSVGEAIADHLTSLGAVMTVDDLAAHAVELDSALRARWRDTDVAVAPPNSQGFVLLQVLELLERLGLDPDPDGADAGRLAEIFRRTAIDRDRHNADPRHARVPVGTLLDDGHLAAIADELSGADQGPASPVHHGDTIALVAADASGLAVSLIQSLYDGFGSGILEPRTGVVLHNRGGCFVLQPDHPNVLAGGKRPAHTLMPVIVTRAGQLAAVAGTMGGGAQPQINAMTLTRALALDTSAQDAVALPRWLVNGMSVGASGRTALIERDVDPRARTALEYAGYALDDVEPRSEDVGHAHLIRVLADGRLDAGTDPRADGEVSVR
jgi:gamma-glutamyltranspeptidase/glutathione hydrolase